MWRLIIFLSVMKCAIAQTVTAVGLTTVNLPSACAYDKEHQCIVFLDFDIFECNSTFPCICGFNTKTNQLVRSHIDGLSFQRPSMIIPAKTDDAPSVSKYIVNIGYEKLVTIIWDCTSTAPAKIDKTLVIFPNNTRVSIGHRDPSGSFLLFPYNLTSCGPKIDPADRTGSIQLWRNGKPVVEAIKGVQFAAGYGYYKKTVYILDVCLLVIVAFKFDCDFNLCYGEVVFDLKKHGFVYGEHYPYSMEVDDQGLIYFADYLTNNIYVVDLSTSSIRVFVTVPGRSTSCITFAENNTMYALLPTLVYGRFGDENVYNNSVPTSFIKMNTPNSGPSFQAVRIS